MLGTDSWSKGNQIENCRLVNLHSEPSHRVKVYFIAHIIVGMAACILTDLNSVKLFSWGQNPLWRMDGCMHCQSSFTCSS